MPTVVPRKATHEFVSKRVVAIMKMSEVDIEDRQRTGVGGDG